MPDIILNTAQENAFQKLKEFTQSPTSKVFILTGYAGTGKSTLMKQYVKWLESKGYVNDNVVENEYRKRVTCGMRKTPPVNYYNLWASTGRAAKILRDKVGHMAETVHSGIYFLAELLEIKEKNAAMEYDGQFVLGFDLSPANKQGSVYIIDEASMVGDTADPNPAQAIYGTGKLLTDLLNHAQTGKVVFVGDNYQLPPVQSEESPALSESYLKSKFGVHVKSAFLDEIMRQDKDNDLVVAANEIRKLADVQSRAKWAKYPLRGYNNINLLWSKEALLSAYVAKLKRDGYNSAVLISGTNKGRNELAQYVRNAMGFRDPHLEVGELLMVVQNNHPSGLMNGDFVVVKSIKQRRKRANLTFLEVEVEELVSNRAYTSLLIENLLYSNHANLDKVEQNGLFRDFVERECAKGITDRGSERFNDDLRKDEYLNALRTVYGYAVTCHKSQGGEWDEVYVDMGWKRQMRSAYQWLYTAMTRAKNTLYLVDGDMITDRRY